MGGVMVLAMGCGGCHKQSQPEIAGPANSKPAMAIDPMEASYKGVRAGSFSLTNAQQSLESSISTLKDVEKQASAKELLSPIGDATDMLDDAGAALADYSAEPPALTEYRLRFAELDERRLKAIQAANEALTDVNDVNGQLDDLLTLAPEEIQPLLEDAQGDLDDASDALTKAITNFGGKVADAGNAPK